MKNFLILLFIGILFASCGNETKETTVSDGKDTVATALPTSIDLPYKASYSSDWSIGDPKYTKIVLDFYKGLEVDSIDQFMEHFEDSIHFKSFDNRSIAKSRNEMFKLAKDFRKRYKSLNEEFHAFVSLHSNDRNEDWVSVWMTERAIRIDGKPDSTIYQENWRFRNGKAYFLGDYARYSTRK